MSKMSVYPVFQCLICHQVPQQPQWSLERRVQKYRSEPHQGQPRTVVQVLDAGDMFLYDSQACWQVHEPTVNAALKLKTSYPVDDNPSNCCRCGRPLDRCQPHVSYAVLCMSVHATATGGFADVVSDEEFAVLCHDCEEPEWPGMAAALAIEPALEISPI